MRYKSFRVVNFKGIKDATVDLSAVAGANVFALVGLNESGKTTVLEAIHSFKADKATGELLGAEHGVPIPNMVPRHQISTFTGDVLVQATISLSLEDKENVSKSLFDRAGLSLDIASLRDEIIMERRQRFSDGDFVNSYLNLATGVRVRGGKERKWREPKSEEKKAIRDAFYFLLPDVAYFPTFIFDFPEEVFLTDRGTSVDRFYRRVFQDILDYDGKGHTIEKDIVRRIRSDERIVPWLAFFSLWTGHDDRDKIQHVMDRASAAATNLIFGRWNRIFGEDAKGKEITINFEVSEGEVRDARGVITKTNAHDLYVTFQIRDGTRRFDVNDRSLGFRWFFAFMLFTQFRVARNGVSPILFLFDEPASNLHAAAQQKLIESFPEVAVGEHCLIYTTHSHYMIDPKWLEQTFIVSNRAEAPSKSVLDAVSLDDESLDIKVEKYRSFAIAHPNQTSYFQPILDRLEVVPSRFDFQRASVVLEGKSDYYILRYASKLLASKEILMIPGVGAGTFGALAALSVGWNLSFLFLLDGDAAGRREKKRYNSDHGVPLSRLVTLADLVPGLVEIEDLIDGVGLKIIGAALDLNAVPDKGQIRRFFQERLASDCVESLGAHFEEKAGLLISALEARFDEAAR